ncbi:hypothetical protein MLD38_036524 [Melastoma candidum]|uniref:Uncharacterized protein n=1 Tax=Melastoma candidum TaxID=119954 RepID=A0ACB9LLU3_9MYRT|nr:hypothetical protein MLD38_036524 [Melastoma candidum]
MYIEELKEGEVGRSAREEGSVGDERGPRDGAVVVVDGGGVKRLLIGAGARFLFYPTLLYNVVRNRVQPEFRWWDRVDQFILLGAVPFPADVPCLKELGVKGVITLNEPYETLVPTALYKAYDINHLVIPTRDYCFAPSLHDISLAVDFIHENVSCGQSTYVHCKAGRGRSTTIVICYLVQHKEMTPHEAYDYLKSIRPRVLLASAQWQAVQQFYLLKMKNSSICHQVDTISRSNIELVPRASFDDASVVVVTESDLVGYDPLAEHNALRSEIWADLRVIYQVRVAGHAALERISCLWLRCHAHSKIPGEEKSGTGNCHSVRSSRIKGISVDIHVY